MGVAMEFLALLLLVPLLFVGDIFGNSGDDADETTGTEGDDELIGNGQDNSISGEGGADTVVGGNGDDALRGGDGDDIVDGGAGDDETRGGDGSDLVLGFDGDDTIYGGSGDDLALGEAGNDTVYLGEGNDLAWVDDEISPDFFATGQLGDDYIDGEAGNDSIWDYDGENTIYGGDGNDDLILLDNTWAASDFRSHDFAGGGDGDDFLLADSGDTMDGGAGNDSFNVIFRDASYDGVTEVNDSAALVMDFNGGQDFLAIQYLTETDVDPDAELIATTDPDTGDVTLSFDGVDLVILTNPTNFNPSDVQFQVN
jgi:Ca2+-binding RTX toxin-like protein